MLNKIIIIISKIASIGIIFVYNIIYIINKFGGVTTIETTKKTMPFVILILLSILVLIAFFWFSNQILVVYREQVKKHPFGFISIILFGGIITTITFLIIKWIIKINDYIISNTQLFIENMAVYQSAITHVLYFTLIGLMIAVLGFIYEKTT